MKLKRMFVFELLAGIMVSALTIAVYNFYPEIIKTSMPHMLILILFNIYILSTSQNVKKQIPEEYSVYQKSSKVAAIVICVILILALINIKNIPHGIFSRYGGNMIVSVIFLARSLSGIILLKYGFQKKTVNNLIDVPDQPKAKDVPFIVINNLLFTLTLLTGIAILGVVYYSLKYESDPLEALIIPGMLFGYTALSIIINLIFNKKRILDEREKYIIFKMTSIAAFFSALVLMLLFVFNGTYIFGKLIKEVWGLLIVPLFMIFWGAAGLITLAKDEGWKWNLLSED